MNMKPSKLHPFLHSAALLEKRVEKMLGSFGVRHRQAVILDALQRNGPASQRHLAKEINVSPGSMSSMTERLVTLGFIVQNSNPDDRRSDILEITPEGLAVLSDVQGVWRDGDKMIEAALGSKDAKQFFAMSEKLRNALGGRAPTKE